MATKCIVCKKELPEGSKIPLCEYHKGVAKENAKKAGVGAGALAVTALVAVKDKVGPVVKEKALPVAGKAIRTIIKR